MSKLHFHVSIPIADEHVRPSAALGFVRRVALSDRRLERALQQASVSEALRTRGERGGGAAPPQLVHIAEEGRVGPEGRQVLEQQRQVAVVPQYLRWEALDGAVAVQEPCRRDRTDPRNAWIAIRGVADEGEEVGDQDGLDSELLADSLRSRIF